MHLDDLQAVSREIVAVLEHFHFVFVSSKSGFRIAGHSVRNMWNRKARREAGKDSGASASIHQVLDHFIPPDVPSDAIFGFDLLVTKKQDALVSVALSWVPPGIEGDDMKKPDFNQSRVHFLQFFEIFQNSVTERVQKRIKS